MKIFMILIVIYFLLIACGNRDNNNSLNQISIKILDSGSVLDSNKIHFHSLHISADSSRFISQESQNVYSSEINDTFYTFFQNCTKNTLGIYSIPYFDLIEYIQLPKSINICNQLYSFFPIEPYECFIVLDNGELFYLNIKNNIESKIDLNKFLKVPYYHIDNYLLDHNQIFFSKDSILYLPLVYEKKVTSKNIEKRPYSTLAIDWKTNTAAYVGDRSIPNWNDGYYGLVHKTYQYYTDSTIIYMFSQNAEIRRFNLETYKVEIFIAKSKFQTNDVPPIKENHNRDDLWNHAKENGIYERLIYNPWKNIYFRFYLHPIPPYTNTGEHSTLNDRRISVLVLNTDFKVLSEKVLPDSCSFIWMAEPTQEGLIITNGPAGDISQSGLNLINISYD